MVKVSHSKAPISEIIFGITYSSKVFDDVAIFKIIQELDKEYPNIQYLNPLTDESLDENQDTLLIESDILNTGVLLFRIRSEDNSKLVQIQGNKIYFNWIRQDNQDPKDIYPGFEYNFNRFIEILSSIQKISSVNPFENVKYYELSYHDRIFWEDYIENLNSVKSLLNLPEFFHHSQNDTKTLSVQQVFRNVERNTIETLSINSAFSPGVRKKVLGIEYSIKGGDGEYRSWFQTSREKQYEVFTSLINSEVLKSWE